LLSVNLAYPKEMGGNGNTTNPEQLFAAGYAACFSNAIIHVAREGKISLKSTPVTAEVGIGPNTEGGFVLTVNLAVQLELTDDQAVSLVKAAHQVCPYSNATRGNIDVVVTENGINIA
jgi:lipoyl-dependent peroxiredoxin